VRKLKSSGLFTICDGGIIVMMRIMMMRVVVVGNELG
jgi:hypothetical protein